MYTCELAEIQFTSDRDSVLVMIDLSKKWGEYELMAKLGQYTRTQTEQRCQLDSFKHKMIQMFLIQTK